MSLPTRPALPDAESEHYRTIEATHTFVEKEVIQFRQQNNQLEGQLKDSARQLAELAQQRDLLTNQVHEREERLRSLRDDLGLTRRELNSLAKKYDQTVGQLIGDVERKDELLKRASAEKEELGRVVGMHEQEQARWHDTCDALKRQIDELTPGGLTSVVQARRRSEQDQAVRRAVSEREEQVSADDEVEQSCKF